MNWYAVVGFLIGFLSPLLVLVVMPLRKVLDKKKRASRFNRTQVGDLETRYEVAGIVTVTVRTIAEKQQVEVEWKFLRSNTSQLVAINYSSGAEMFAEPSLTIEEFAFSWGSAMVSLITGKQWKDPHHERAILARNSALTPNVQPFAPASKLRSDTAVQVLPRRVWYIEFYFAADGDADQFIATVNLVHAPPPAKQPTPTEHDLWKQHLDGIMHGFRKYEEAQATGERLIKEINARTDLDAPQKGDRVKYVTRELEKLLMALRQNR